MSGAPGPMPNMGAGMPGGMPPNMAGMMNNPAMMQQAQEMMKNPDMMKMAQQMMQNMFGMLGGGQKR